MATRLTSFAKFFITLVILGVIAGGGYLILNKTSLGSNLKKKAEESKETEKTEEPKTGFNDDDNTLGKGYGFRIYPNIGYFFIDKMAGGFKLGFNYGKTEGNSSMVGYGLGPFVRYYFLNPDKRVNVFAEANYNYYISKTQNFDATKGYNYNFKAGPEIFFNSSVGLEVTINYSSSNSTLS